MLTRTHVRSLVSLLKLAGNLWTTHIHWAEPAQRKVLNWNDNRLHLWQSVLIWMVLTFRTFFSNMSNLFKNNMKDVFCPEKRWASLFIDIDTNVNCHIIKDTEIKNCWYKISYAKVEVTISKRKRIKWNLKTWLLQDPLEKFLSLHHSVLVFILIKCLIIPGR